MRRTSTLIAGGGPAGAAAAIILARSGARPLVIERHRVTEDALCGGFLSWNSVEMLRRLGVSADVLSGHRITHIRLISSGGTANADLPRPAIGVSRRQLDGILLAHAERAGAAVERGCSIRRAAAGLVELTDGEVVHCDSLFLATGKHDCRGLQRSKATRGDPMLGLRVRIPPAPGLTHLLANAIELHLFRGGYAGLVLQEDGSANLCMAVRKSRLAESRGNPGNLLIDLAKESPRLGDRIAYVASRPSIDAIAGIPYGWRQTKGVSGLFRLGDQAAVIPSLAGEGIGIALASGILGAKWQLKAGAEAASHFQARLAQLTARPVRLATLLSVSLQNPAGQVVAPVLLSAFPVLGRLLAEATRIR